MRQVLGAVYINFVAYSKGNKISKLDETSEKIRIILIGLVERPGPSTGEEVPRLFYGVKSYPKCDRISNLCYN